MRPTIIFTYSHWTGKDLKMFSGSAMLLELHFVVFYPLFRIIFLHCQIQRMLLVWLNFLIIIYSIFLSSILYNMNSHGFKGSSCFFGFSKQK